MPSGTRGFAQAPAVGGLRCRCRDGSRPSRGRRTLAPYAPPAIVTQDVEPEETSGNEWSSARGTSSHQPFKALLARPAGAPSRPRAQPPRSVISAVLPAARRNSTFPRDISLARRPLVIHRHLYGTDGCIAVGADRWHDLLRGGVDDAVQDAEGVGRGLRSAARLLRRVGRGPKPGGWPVPGAGRLLPRPRRASGPVVGPRSGTALGLSGEVAGADLRSLLEGRHPKHGRVLVAGSVGRRPVDSTPRSRRRNRCRRCGR